VALPMCDRIKGLQISCERMAADLSDTLMVRNGKKMSKLSVCDSFLADAVERKNFSAAVVPATTSPRAPGNAWESTSRDPAVSDTSCVRQKEQSNR